MKIFIPLDDSTLPALRESDRLVPYCVGHTVLSQVGDEWFFNFEERLSDQTTEPVHPQPEHPALPLSRR